MKYSPAFPVAASFALVALTACVAMPPDKTPLGLARIEHQAAHDNAQTVALAAPELRAADAAMSRANAADAGRETAAMVDHLAYLASQRTAIAQETGRQKAAEQGVADAQTTRDRMQLDARTREADAARQRTLQAESQAREAELRNRRLEEQIKDLNAQATPRGWVVTFGDVLFRSGQDEFNPDSARDIDKLADFLHDYPQRNVLVEGFTDSTGNEAANLALSSRRSVAVREALIDHGVHPDRVATRGYGQSYPVADNSSINGRRLNRRVEIILSDDTGLIPAR